MVEGAHRSTPAVAVVAALDTKGEEATYIARSLEGAGVRAVLIDVGVLGTPSAAPDVTRDEVASAAGTTVAELARRRSRADAVAAMGRGVARIVLDLHTSGAISGVFGFGGGTNSSIASAAMRALPVGVPKLLVTTTVRSAGRFFGTSDLLVLYSIVDIAGINTISKPIFDNAVAATVGMVTTSRRDMAHDGRPVIGATMFGVTTPGMSHARALLESRGYEVLVFHANGSGGQALEDLVRKGSIDGVFDYTTTEIADLIAGGICSAGAGRLGAAAENGVPALIGLGALDVVNLGPRESIPDSVRDRTLHAHTGAGTLMRTSPAEAVEIARTIAAALNRSQGPVEVFVPQAGLSELDVEGGPFQDQSANDALVDELTTQLRADIPLTRHPGHVNDPAFAEAMVDRFDALFRAARSTSTHRSTHEGDDR